MNPTLGIKIHRKRVADSVFKIENTSDKSPIEILLSRCAIYEYFIDDAGLGKQFTKWVEKKKIQDNQNG
ncbi:hypothetical protein Q4554_14655 [Leptospira santarosai]|uniref:hypothetical protein n=1 Tax=Leptospira santarosai TaxID=28183 RepID=UPI0026E2ACAC|nr:hypothetical protein [Leptospira santarosai]MDO6395319.1 hypothetical protein [Leptospira santarosai]